MFKKNKKIILELIFQNKNIYKLNGNNLYTRGKSIYKLTSGK